MPRGTRRLSSEAMAEKRKQIEGEVCPNSTPATKRLRLRKVAPPHRIQTSPIPSAPEAMNTMTGKKLLTPAKKNPRKNGGKNVKSSSNRQVTIPAVISFPSTSREGQLTPEPVVRYLSMVPVSNEVKAAMVDELEELDGRLYNIVTQTEDLRKDYQSLFRKMFGMIPDPINDQDPEADKNDVDKNDTEVEMVNAGDNSHGEAEPERNGTANVSSSSSNYRSYTSNDDTEIINID